MDLNLILSIALGFALLVVVFIYLKTRKVFLGQRIENEDNAKKIEDYESLINTIERDGVSGYAIQNQSGENLVTAHQVFKFPSNAMDITKNKELTSWATHLTSDIVKAGMSIPNKSIELVFKANVQNGLDSGELIMMTTKNNEVLADAINLKTGKVVGKGRIVENGKMKQLLSGGYHLVSIAVAQSHLAEISQKLDLLNSKLDEVKYHLEVLDKAKIQGAIDYYKEVLKRIEENKLSTAPQSPIATNLEHCIKDSHDWVNTALNKFEALNNSIRTLEDKDIAGTGDTYKALKRLLEQAKKISNDYDLILKFSNISNAVLGYIDSKEETFTRVNVQCDKWSDLIEEFKCIGLQKANQRFKSSTFNSGETLELRKENIDYRVRNIHGLLLANLDNYSNQQELINDQLKILKADEIRMGVSFDENTNIQKAVLLN